MEPTSYKLHPWPILSPRLQIKNPGTALWFKGFWKDQEARAKLAHGLHEYSHRVHMPVFSVSCEGFGGTERRFLPMREHLISRRRVLLLAARPGPAPNAKGRQSGSGFWHGDCPL
jgi:hypothetical protein